jgi:hypothetical protein
MDGDPDPQEGSLEAIGFHGSEDYQPPRPGKRVAVWVAGFLAVVAGAAAIVAVVLPGGAARTAPAGFVPAGGSPDQDAMQVTTAFLQAWQRGDLGQAARYTSRPAAAQEALAAYQRHLHLRKLTATVLAATGPGATATATSGGAQETVRYAVSATVALSDDPRAQSGTWRYTASLVALEQPDSRVWSVAWAPEVLAPDLTGSTYPVAVQVPPAITGAVDASGTGLATYSDAGLTTIAGDLQNQAQADSRPGTPGLAVEVQTAAGDQVPGSETVVVTPRAGPGLATTIDGRAEAAARSAVGAYPSSSMVAIQPSTGKILAIANAGDSDDALTARVAPGSTMKVITAAALFNAGVLTASSGVACPQSYTVQGITYHNDNNEAQPPGTPFITDFAQSCNNAFSTQWTHLSGLLASTAQTYFGLNQPWNIGIAGQSASYFSAPADASGSELAQEAFGEGQLLASPLAMASVAATVDTGTFRQPYLLAGSPQVTATALPAGTDAQLQEMMRAVVTSGTAAPIGFGSGVYAKTGTADIAGQDQPNSWLIAFDPAQNIAVACLVIDAGYGAQYAGSEVKAFLDSY